MANAPEPIVLTQAASNPSAYAPEPYVVVGGIPVTKTELVATLKTLTGYSASATQYLENVAGTLTWVTV